MIRRFIFGLTLEERHAREREVTARQLLDARSQLEYWQAAVKMLEARGSRLVREHQLQQQQGESV